MPIYEYKCSGCGHQLEEIQKFSDEPLKNCPECSQATLVKLVSAAGFQLKGTGWYVTDYSKKGKPPTNNASGDTTGSSSSDNSSGDSSSSSGSSSSGDKSSTPSSDSSSANNSSANNNNSGSNRSSSSTNSGSNSNSSNSSSSSASNSN